MRDLLDIVKEYDETAKDICGESFIFALGRMAQNLDHTIFEDEEGNHTEEYNKLASFIFDIFMWARAVQDDRPTPVIWDMEREDKPIPDTVAYTSYAECPSCGIPDGNCNC